MIKARVHEIIGINFSRLKKAFPTLVKMSHGFLCSLYGKEKHKYTFKKKITCN